MTRHIHIHVNPSNKKKSRKELKPTILDFFLEKFLSEKKYSYFCILIKWRNKRGECEFKLGWVNIFGGLLVFAGCMKNGENI